MRTLGTKVPLHLPTHSHWEEVHQRGQQLREHLETYGLYDRSRWEQQLGIRRGNGNHLVPVGSRSGPPPLEQARELWWQRKRAEGCSQASFEKHYGRFIALLDADYPFTDASLLAVIETTDPHSPTRKRLVNFLRELTELSGAQWNAPLLDPLQMRGKRVQHRDQPFFSDEEILQIVHGAAQHPHRGWLRVLALMAVYGLRPWEAWIAEASPTHRHCLWIPQGKKNSKGTNPPRTVPPFHPEWVEAFHIPRLLLEPPPRLNNLALAGSRTNQQLRRYGFCQAGDGRTSYGFRHAYARRLHSPRHRVTDTHGALFMGHTVAAHNKAYRQWIEGQADPLAAFVSA